MGPLVLLTSAEYDWACLYVNLRLHSRVNLRDMEKISELVLQFQCSIKVMKQAFRQIKFGEVESLLEVEIAKFNDSELQRSYERLTNDSVDSELAEAIVKLVELTRPGCAEAYPYDGFVARNIELKEVEELIVKYQASQSRDARVETLSKLYNYTKNNNNSFHRHFYALTSKELFYCAVKVVDESLQFEKKGS